MISVKQTALLAILTLSCNPGMTAQEPSWSIESSSLEMAQRLVLANENGYDIFEIAEISPSYQITINEAQRVTITNQVSTVITVYNQQTQQVEANLLDGFKTMYATGFLGASYKFTDILDDLLRSK